MARPNKYDQEKVLEAVMMQFWEKGYSATSMVDLKKATGLHAGSLYSTYKSKEAIFLLTLTHYCDASVAALQRALTATEDPIKNIHMFFNKKFNQTEIDSCHGCFYVNSLIEMAPQNAQVQTILDQYTQAYRQAFSTALQLAKDNGLLSASREVSVLADQLITMIFGLKVFHRANLSIDYQSVISAQLNALLLD